MNQQTDTGSEVVATRRGARAAEEYVRERGFEPGVAQVLDAGAGPRNVLFMVGEARDDGTVDVTRFVAPFEEPTS